jgi:amidase
VGLATAYGHVPPPPAKRIERDPDCLVIGPLARSAEDLALMLRLIAGPRHQARPSLLRPPRATTQEGLRVALWSSDPFAPADQSVRSAVEEAARRLAAAGAIVEATARPAISFAEAFEVFALYNHAVIGWGLPGSLRDKIAAGRYEKGDLSHPALQARGIRITPGDYRILELRRRKLQSQWARFFEKYDVVVCPPAPVGAIRHDATPDVHKRRLTVDGVARPYLDFLVWSSLASGPGLPAAVAPIGFGPDAMPRGVQIIGGMGDDLTTIAVARMIGESLSS